jgi:hypothetical protein
MGAPPPGADPPTNLSDEETLFPSADVAGIKLGMTVDQVRAILKGHQTMQQYNEGKSSTFSLMGLPMGVKAPKAPLYVSSIRAWSPDQKERVEVLFSMPPERVFRLEKYKYFASNNPGSSEAIRKAMLDKYGSPKLESSSGFYLWLPGKTTQTSVSPDCVAEGHGTEAPPAVMTTICGPAYLSARNIYEAGKTGLSGGFTLRLHSPVLEWASQNERMKTARAARAQVDADLRQNAQGTKKTDL